jgi:hypothetical protein
MITALEIVTGLVLTLTLAMTATVLSAWQLGRMVSRDDEQRELDDTEAGGLQFQRRRLTARASYGATSTKVWTRLERISDESSVYAANARVRAVHLIGRSGGDEIRR